MLKNLTAKFLKTSVIALGANVAAYFFKVVDYVPSNLNHAEQWIWGSIIVSGFVGAGHVLERIANWNPNIANK